MSRVPLLLLLLSAVASPIARSAERDERDERIERAQSFARRIEGKVFRDRVAAQWAGDGRSFHYRVRTGPNSEEYVFVDAVGGTIHRAESAEELDLPQQAPIKTSRGAAAPKRTARTGERTSLQVENTSSGPIELFWVNQSGESISYGRVAEGETKSLQTYDGHVWLLKSDSGQVWGYFEATHLPLKIETDKPPRRSESSRPRRPRRSDRSPDGKWSIRFENHNAVLSGDGSVARLTEDGTAETPYRGPIAWSPDSRYCVVMSVRDVPRPVVKIVESSPRDQLQPKLITYDYRKPGDDLPQAKPVVISVDKREACVIDDELFADAFDERGRLDIRWSPESAEFYFNHNRRGHNLYRVLACDPVSGQVRVVVEERSETFIDYNGKTWRHWLDSTGELLWMSERDGWAHLYLYDVASGEEKNQVTRGKWVVRQVLNVDAESRRIWFLAGGVRSGEDPYHRHLCRVDFDGSGFVRLTEGDGDHAIEFSPDRKYFIDRWSRVDHPAVSELRRSEDGELVCELERGDISRLQRSGWTVPERFTAKGRDGQTDIYGIIIKPSDFDPAKKYPVVEEVYAGPHGAFVPKGFGLLTREHAIAELGFVVVRVDGMGTNHRGKRFHDLCWKNLEDAGFPDRIAWIGEAAQSRPWMDLSRVGIYGGSAGGQTAMRALIDHHNFYHVAVADCGCHDNRMDKIWWNEQWLGRPPDDAYLRASNVEHADRLEGKLLLIVGELDRNVDPASTMQVVGALQRAGKSFEFMPIIGSGHGAAETRYGSRLRMDFLMRHLSD